MEVTGWIMNCHCIQFEIDSTFRHLDGRHEIQLVIKMIIHSSSTVTHGPSHLPIHLD